MKMEGLLKTSQLMAVITKPSTVYFCQTLRINVYTLNHILMALFEIHYGGVQSQSLVLDQNVIKALREGHQFTTMHGERLCRQASFCCFGMETPCPGLKPGQSLRVKCK